MISFTVINNAIEAKLRDSLVKFCQQSGIVMPKNGCDTVTAWNIASAMEDYLYKCSDTIRLTDEVSLKLERYEPSSKMTRFAIMWQGKANMFGQETEVYAKVGSFGVPTFIAWETSEFLSAVTDMINDGNENTPQWSALVHDRDAVNNWFEEKGN